MDRIFGRLLPLMIGFILDVAWGDPAFIYHPVRLIGLLIEKLEAVLRKEQDSSRAGLLKGILLAAVVLSLSFLLPWLILSICYSVNKIFGVVVEGLFCWQILAVHSLKKESMRVSHALQKEDMAEAREYLSWIVGRDTKGLDTEGIIKAAVETVAENTSDGVIAPMLFIVVGGAPLGFLYKAINTLDSMVGYKNERYLYFGRFSAKLDDIVNFIPARIAAFLMLLSGGLLGFDLKSGFRVFLRDRYNHPSPNSAQTESICAGLLGIRLAGSAQYGGVLVEKPYIGDDIRRPGIKDIQDVNKIMATTAFLGVVVFSIIKYAVLLKL